jgi:lipoate-protein ligase A
MDLLDLSCPSPEENLALDETLLLRAEEEDTGETLRFWEPSTMFVVLGYSRRAEEEVFLNHCAKDRIPVLRRYSGGGTVLQSPGCLNYSLILRIVKEGPRSTIRGTTSSILGQHAGVLQLLLEKTVEVRGESDLTIEGRKCSGNAQRRLNRYVLFHGTFLLNADISRMERYLPIPLKQPAYRKQRSHSDFLTNLPLPAEELKHALMRSWNAAEKNIFSPADRLEELVRTRYARKEWNYRR